jgi:hypothetical protein
MKLETPATLRVVGVFSLGREESDRVKQLHAKTAASATHVLLQD